MLRRRGTTRAIDDLEALLWHLTDEDAVAVNAGTKIQQEEEMIPDVEPEEKAATSQKKAATEMTT